MNRENLKKLADGLRGPLALEFDMWSFASGDGVGPLESAIEILGNGCGTAACACGHATYLVAPKLYGEYFAKYSKRVFGLDDTELYGAWDWCFSCEWKDRDNTPSGAADRIEWMLKHGVPSEEDVRDMMAGDADLCYRTPK